MSRALYPTLACLLLAVAASGQQPGTLLWSYQTDELVYATPAIGADGTIYLASNDDNLYALRHTPFAGEEIWTFPAGDDIDSAPTIGPDGTIYFGCWDNFLYAVDPDGTLKWAFETGSLITSSPAIGADGTIYFGGVDNFFYALNPDGSLKWEYFVGAAVDGSPSIGSDGTIYFGTGDGRLIAIPAGGPVNDAPLWTFQVTASGDDSPRILGSPAIGYDGTIYFGNGLGEFHAVEPNGAPRWSAPLQTTEEISASSVIGPEGNIYFVSRDGQFTAVTPDQEVLWSLELRDVFFSSPVVDAEGNVYLAYYGGIKDGTENQTQTFIACFDSEGVEKWLTVVDGIVDASLTISPDGVLYVGSYDGNLYAFEANASLAEAAWPKFQRDIRNRSRLLREGRPEVLTTLDAHWGWEGEDYSLFADYASELPVRIIWRRNGVPLPGENEDTLVFRDLIAEDAGVYDALITNDAGTTALPRQFLAVINYFFIDEEVTPKQLILGYSEPFYAEDTTFLLERSDDLQTWSTDGIGIALAQDLGDVIVLDVEADMPESDGHLRLDVEVEEAAYGE